jgi:uncharacterized protein (TIGR03000 family)
VAKLLLRIALCAALTLCGGAAAVGGDLDRTDGPEVRGRASTIRVHPPTPEARLFFEGTLLQGMGRERTFRSPVLEEGKRYAYTVVAVWVENGREVVHEMRVKFWAGDDVVLDFRR